MTALVSANLTVLNPFPSMPISGIFIVDIAQQLLKYPFTGTAGSKPSSE
jgi:hypothetical protein